MDVGYICTKISTEYVTVIKSFKDLKYLSSINYNLQVPSVVLVHVMQQTNPIPDVKSRVAYSIINKLDPTLIEVSFLSDSRYYFNSFVFRGAGSRVRGVN